MKPLVSVICISYQHEPFINEAINSLFAQTYDKVELIVLDDASSDGSGELLKELFKEKEHQLIIHKSNQGYTKTFNEGLALSNGEFIIDFALDDVMEPEFIEKSVEAFTEESIGVVFSNADYIDQDSKHLANHTEELIRKKMIKSVPEGDVFEWMLRRYFVCTPTMMIRREVFDRLGGYDESLAYEDLDFWIRSSRVWHYKYVDEVLFKKRKLKTSMSSQRHMHHYNEQMSSVYLVCEKAFQLCRSKNEFKALWERLNYEYRQCVKYNAENLADKYVAFLAYTRGQLTLKSRLYRWYKRKFRVIR